MKGFVKILAIGLCAITLSGCALLEKTPTPEELIDGIAAMEFDGYVDLTLKGTYYIETDDGEKGVEGKARVEYTDEVYHCENTDLEITMNGTTANDVGMENWADRDYYYGNMIMQGVDYGWAYSEMSSRDYKDLARLEDVAEEISAELFDDLVLMDREKKDNYVVTGTIAGDDLYDLVFDIFAKNQSVEAIIEDAEDFAEDLVFDVKAEFDDETRELIKFEIVLNEKESDIPRAVDELEIELKLTINEIDPEGEDRLEIPEEVTEDSMSLEDWAAEMAQLITDGEEPEQPEDTDDSGISDEELRQIEGKYLFLETNIRGNVPEADITIYDRMDETGWLGGKVLNYSYYDEEGAYLEAEFRYYLNEEDAEYMFLVTFGVLQGKYGDPLQVDEENGTFGVEFISENLTEAVEIYLDGKNFFLLNVALGSETEGSMDLLDDKLDEVLHNAIYPPQ